LAAEMIAYGVGIGELRTNYAGFVDNGFGGELGTRAVLEVRPHDVPFLLEDGQVFFKLAFYRAAEEPEVAYGERGLGSHYARQGLRLSKHFRESRPRAPEGMPRTPPPPSSRSPGSCSAPAPPWSRPIVTR